MKLISISDFVLKVDKETNDETSSIMYSFNHLVKYANFLKQPLTLGMFVPCDDDGNVLEEPTSTEKNEFGGSFSTIEEQAELCCEIEQFRAAKDRVLFEGFEDEELDDIKIMFDEAYSLELNYIVEDLFLICYDIPTLTKTAIKLLGL